jgi:hypothetical protein
MLKRIALLAVSSVCLLGAGISHTAGAQMTRRLSQKDIPVLVNELRIRLNMPDTASPAAPAPARISDKDYDALVGAAVQALHDVTDPSDLAQLKASADQWGSRDQAGATLRKEAQARSVNAELLMNDGSAVMSLLEMLSQTSK